MKLALSLVAKVSAGVVTICTGYYPRCRSRLSSRITTSLLATGLYRLGAQLQGLAFIIRTIRIVIVVLVVVLVVVVLVVVVLVVVVLVSGGDDAFDQTAGQGQGKKEMLNNHYVDSLFTTSS